KPMQRLRNGAEEISAAERRGDVDEAAHPPMGGPFDQAARQLDVGLFQRPGVEVIETSGAVDDLVDAVLGDDAVELVEPVAIGRWEAVLGMSECVTVASKPTLSSVSMYCSRASTRSDSMSLRISPRERLPQSTFSSSQRK